jgi:hypothetical protein
MKVELIQPFGPKILKTYLSQDIIDAINTYIEKVPTEDFSHMLVGRIETQGKIDTEFLKILDFENLLLELCKTYIKTYPINYKNNLYLSNAWFNDCKEMDYNPVHTHNAFFSGIVYLQVPELTNDTNDGQTHFLYGQQLDFSNSILKVAPEVGMLLLFPSYLMHLVWPTRVNGNRRTMSFNLHYA